MKKVKLSEGLSSVSYTHLTASGQHGIRDNDGTLLNGVWKLAVIFMGFVCDFVSV